MKFYRNFNDHEVRMNKSTIICSNDYSVIFYKNGKIHNAKNAAYIIGEHKNFYLNDKPEAIFNKKNMA